MNSQKKVIDGVLLLDKPEGLSSAGLVSKVKKALNAKKVGHAGTLDPFATGLMVICLGKATKLSNFFLNDNKTYIAELELGKETDTQDIEGTVINSCTDFSISEKKLTETINKFVGEQKQIPPVYSALKHKGVPLYKLARSGKPVVKPPRDINVFYINLLQYESPTVILEISCSKGTYIRTLCTDIGKALGCYGFLRNLRRTFASGFYLKNSTTLSDLSEDKIIDMTETLNDLEEVRVDVTLAKKIANGVQLTQDDITWENYDKPLKIVHLDRLIAIIEKKDREIKYNYCCVFNY
ncbi:MAG: tRNA pseudouridine(55) synthase TruB [Desulfobacterales bacterium]|nr:tRNA pseudouridine(55) synthase TruB [Desulfobacterales bacterium]MCP4158827.1 tRNA pseudouridine(55) synthase TruB [Deltaproteobacteria bacterium]